MFKKKNIALTLSLLALLASCGEKPATSSASSENTTSSSHQDKPAPTPLADILADYRANLTAKGTTNIFYGTEVHSTSSFVTKFTSNSYHFEETNEKGEKVASSDLFRIVQNGESYVAVSSVNENNQVVMTPARDQEENNLIGWSTVQNPFLDSVTDPGFFDYDEKEGVYYLDFAKDTQERGNRYQAALDLISKFSVVIPYGFDSVKLSVEGKKITAVNIVTRSFSINNPKTTVHYEVIFMLDNDQSHDHSATMATPFEHLDYHDTLQAAFDKLLKSPSYSFERDASSLSSVSMPHLKGYVSSDAFYYSVPNQADNYAALIVKDSKVYEVTKEGDNYAYDETPLADDNDTLLRAIPVGYYPLRAEPVEAFLYSESSHKYVLDQIDSTGTSLADYFAFYFDTFGYILDEDSMASLTFSSVEVELNVQNEIGTIALHTESKGSVLYSFTYDTSALPFDPAKIETIDIAKDAYGTYQGTFATDATIHAGETYTIHFSREANTDKYTKEKHPYVYKVTLSYGTGTSLYTALDVSYSTTMGISFVSGAEDYTIAKQKDGTYLLTVQDEEGKTASCLVTKTA